MRRPLPPLWAMALACIAGPVAGQQAERLTSGAIYESYGFGDGYVVDRISQLTVPVALSVDLGTRAGLVLSTGYVSVTLETADPAQLLDQKLDGPLDTEMRLSLEVLEQRLVTFVAATLPTGRQSVIQDGLAVLVALSNDAIGFSAPSLGGGGSLSAGFSTAVPIGRFALGLAATGAYSFAYQPIIAQPVDLSPGAEARLRVGLEGALASRTYLRVALSAAARQKDRIAGASTHGLGRRGIGYVTLEQGVGAAVLSLYAFDVYRGSPQLEPTALGAAILPRGNLLATGASLTLQLAGTTLVPSAEYRLAWAAATPESSRLHRQASSLRAGAELRRPVGSRLALVLRGQGAFGDARQGPAFYDFTGFRAGMTLELTP